jgi:hypothetical protein
MLFPNMWFDEDKCEDGLNALRHYRYGAGRRLADRGQQLVGIRSMIGLSGGCAEVYGCNDGDPDLIEGRTNFDGQVGRIRKIRGIWP